MNLLYKAWLRRRKWQKELFFLSLWARSFFCFYFFLRFLWPSSLGRRRKRGRTPRTQTRFMLVPTLVCFARKIKEHKYRFNLPMDALYLSHFPLSVRTFECGFRRSSCPFAMRISIVLYGPRTVKLTTWPRDSPSSHSGVEGEWGQSVHASRPMSVSRLFGARWDIELHWAAANFARIIDFTSFACS